MLTLKDSTALNLSKKKNDVRGITSPVHLTPDAEPIQNIKVTKIFSQILHTYLNIPGAGDRRRLYAIAMIEKDKIKYALLLLILIGGCMTSQQSLTQSHRSQAN